MPGRKLRRFVWLAGVLSLVAATAVVIAAVSSADPGPRSIPLHGKMLNIVQTIPCADSHAVPVGVCSDFQAIGDIKGDGHVVVDTFPDRDHFGYSEAHTVIHTGKGDLRCHEAALFSAPGADGVASFVDMCLIDVGTGIYAGASGYIQESGTFDFGTGVGNLDYQGKITFAR